MFSLITARGKRCFNKWNHRCKETVIKPDGRTAVYTGAEICMLEKLAYADLKECETLRAYNGSYCWALELLVAV